MARVSLANHARLLWLTLRGGLTQFAGRAGSHKLLHIGALSLASDRLLISPQDLRTADTTRASEFYSGRFSFVGKVVISDGRSIFEMQPPSEDWAIALYGFGWLRHLHAADSGITRANARALIDEWIALQGGWHRLSWRPDILSRRVMSWLCHAPLILADADPRFYRRFVRSLVRQARHLRRTAGNARRGGARLQASTALCYAALCILSQGRHIKSATARLKIDLDRQILPDGGHIGRDPGAAIELLMDLLPLRQTYVSRNIAPPPALIAAIERMMPMLRFFRHTDGDLARFNGMGQTSIDSLSTLLAYDDTYGTPLSNATHSGYQRIEAAGNVLIMDTGRAPPLEFALEAHAGCLSFELSSSRQNLIVVNSGVPTIARDEWRPVARATAAHSTVTFNEQSSAEFGDSPSIRGVLGGVPLLGGPTKVTVTREERAGATVLRASHDGYAGRYGIIHERRLVFHADGTRLEGEDLFLAADGSVDIPGDHDRFAVRFHLHPSIKPTMLTDGKGVMLMAPNKEVWNFHARVDRVEIEDSVYLAAPEGPRRSTQMVIRGQAHRAPRVLWTLTQAAAPAGRRPREQEPLLPL
jgi:uncharacterized heparinase superfamily protein